MKKILSPLFLIVCLCILFSCGEKLPVIDSLDRSQFKLVNQNKDYKIFPKNIRGKIAVVGYIFTNCPDICPLTTNNMRLIQEQLKKEKISGVEFVSISFDTQNDTPEMLKKFADIRNLELNNWTFFTGHKETIDSLLSLVNVMAIPSDSTIFDDGKTIYYYVHTDRIQLIDSKSRIRKNYPGSKINIEEIVANIKTLQGE